MQELLKNRTYRSKTFDNEDGTRTTEISSGDMFYKNELGEFIDVDYTLEDKGMYWQMKKASYNIYIAKDFSANQLIRFDNKFEDANHTIYYEPKQLAWVKNPNLSDMQVFRDQQAVTGVLAKSIAGDTDDVVRYTDAFGEGIHFEITVLRTGFKKEIVIDSKDKLELPPTAQHKLVALFRYQGDGLKVLKKNTEQWDKDAYFDALDGFDVEEDAKPTAKSFIRPAYIVDANDDMENVRVFWKFHNGSLWQAKVLPKTFLKNAEYPVRADTVTSVYADASDGHLDGYTSRSPTYATAHDQATADRMNTTGANSAGAAGARYPDGNYFFSRVFYTFDVSAVGTDTVSAATVRIGNVDNSTGAYDHSLVGCSKASANVLALADFDSWTATRLATDISMLDATGNNTFTLNSAGLTAIENSSTYFETVVLFADDVDENPVATDRYSSLIKSEYSGTTYDPYLSVTHAAGASATPTSQASIII